MPRQHYIPSEVTRYEAKLELEDRMLRTNKQKTGGNPDDYDLYLKNMVGRGGYIQSFDEWEQSHQ